MTRQVEVMLILSAIIVAIMLAANPRKPTHSFIEPVPICYGYDRQPGQPCRHVPRQQNI